MENNTNQPRENDAVLGGQNLPISAAVLGGLAAVKQRFASPVLEQKIAALKDAVKYGDPGVDFVIEALGNPIEEINNAAYLLLQEKASSKGKEALLNLEYRRLESLLATTQWQKADGVTSDIMLLTCNRKKAGYLEVKDLENFPCDRLRMLDELWMKYSKKRFGFSVQKSIWEKVGGTSVPNWDVWCRFGKKTGWYVKGNWLFWNDLSFSLNAPMGHLPRGGAFSGWGLGDFWTGCRMFSCLSSRLESCAIVPTKLKKNQKSSFDFWNFIKH
ncbi:MAG TPA: GUN4 domain-containing protein [Leptolyngbyaceae cyanobacterium]